MIQDFSDLSSAKLKTESAATRPEGPRSIIAHSIAGEVKARIAKLRTAITDNPSEYRHHYELGVALGEADRFEEAIGSLLTALRLEPACDQACCMIGSAFALRGMLEPALEWFERAQQINPSNTSYLHQYGVALLGSGREAYAKEVLMRWAESQPGNPIANHLASAALGCGTVTKASSQYVVSLFDGCAARFDERLARLRYSGPQLVLDALTQFAAPAAECGHTFGEVLDVGCGTGLVGGLLRPVVKRLVGVDLSPGMLQKASERGVYDELVEADMVTYLRDHPHRFDAITAADVLTYVGDIVDFFQAAAKALKPRALVVALAEALNQGETYRLNLNGRFSHAPDYMRRVMESSGFTVADIRQDTMRREADRPVPTLVAVGMKGGY